MQMLNEYIHQTHHENSTFYLLNVRRGHRCVPCADVALLDHSNDALLIGQRYDI